MWHRRLWLVGLALASVGTVYTVTAAEIDRDIEVIAQVGNEGTSSAEARSAADRLTKHGVALLPRLLEAMNTDNIVAANWYRTVFDDIVERAVSDPTAKLPLEALRAHVRDGKSQGRSRRMALALLERVEPGFGARFLPTMLDDPEFRADAIAMVLAEADNAHAQGDKATALAASRRAFAHARRSDQIVKAADRLKALGEEVSIVDHMGLVTRWYLLGPFDAPETSGYGKRFPPEEKIDLEASYAGKDGAKIRWQVHQSADRLGQINLVQAVAPVAEAVGYAYAELVSPSDQEVEMRCGADDNCSVWLNGERIFGRDQWLNGTRLDRFTAPARLKRGVNRVLVKICQGPQHVNPAVGNNWSLQLRFCDATGAAVGLRTIRPTADEIEAADQR